MPPKGEAPVTESEVSNQETGGDVLDNKPETEATPEVPIAEQVAQAKYRVDDAVKGLKGEWSFLGDRVSRTAVMREALPAYKKILEAYTNLAKLDLGIEGKSAEDIEIEIAKMDALQQEAKESLDSIEGRAGRSIPAGVNEQSKREAPELYEAIQNFRADNYTRAEALQKLRPTEEGRPGMRVIFLDVEPGGRKVMKFTGNTLCERTTDLEDDLEDVQNEIGRLKSMRRENETRDLIKAEKLINEVLKSRKASSQEKSAT